MCEARHIEIGKQRGYVLKMGRHVTFTNYFTKRSANLDVTIITPQHICCTNCTVYNRTVLTVITQKLPLHVQLHNSTAHLLYKLYSLQLNCTYSNYTQCAVTCSAAQQHSTFTVYKLHSLQPNCTYSNYRQAAATCSANDF